MTFLGHENSEQYHAALRRAAAVSMFDVEMILRMLEEDEVGVYDRFIGACKTDMDKLQMATLMVILGRQQMHMDI